MNPPSLTHRFGGLDWGIVVCFGLLLLAMGTYFARRQRTTEEYFVAGRNQRSWYAGISLFAALFTLVAYIGVPGEVVQHGPVLVLGSLAALPFSYWTISRFLIPAFMRSPITSGYELLETRFGHRVRRVAALAFVCFRVVWMALILFASATVLVSVAGWDRHWLVGIEASIGIFATVYTLAGGIEAAMATAVLEFSLLLLGAILTIALIVWRTGSTGFGSLPEFSSHWDRQPWVATSLTVRVTVATTVLSYFISTVCSGGSDQVAIQRYLTTRDVPAARRAVLFGHLAVGTVLLMLGIVGVALLSYYHTLPAELPAGFHWGTGGDVLFPYFLSHALPPGVSGLVVAGLLTSAISGMSPCINSVIAVLQRDLLGFRGDTGRKGIANARWLAAGIGLLAVAVSFAMAEVHGNLVEVSGRTVNLFFYPMFGLFFFALFCRRLTPTSAVVGSAVGLAAGIAVGFSDVLFGGAPISFQWIGPISLATTLAVGTVASRLI